MRPRVKPLTPEQKKARELRYRCHNQLKGRVYIIAVKPAERAIYIDGENWENLKTQNYYKYVEILINQFHYNFQTVIK